jgi:CO/xanthine dehydrogenase FAD-binding subunit
MTLLRPRSVEEALRLYAANPGAVPLAGGTDFMVAWNAGEANGQTILDLSRLAPWKRIAETKTGVRIGALVSHRELQAHPLIRKRLPLLVEACATIGGDIQARGTLAEHRERFPRGHLPARRLRGPGLVMPGRPERSRFSKSFTGVKKTAPARG